MTEIIVPTIHPNGDTAKTLIEQLLSVRNALVSTTGALRDAAPNARNYYPQGDMAFTAARNQYNRRMDALLNIQDEILADLRGIQKQKGANHVE